MRGVQQFLRWTVIGGVFLLPVIPFIVSNALFFPYITGKNFSFRIIVEIVSALWLALALCVPQYRPRRSWILAAYAVFVLIIGIADMQGAYWFKSIWSNYERMEGWVTLAHLLAYLVVVASVMNTETLWRRLFQTSLVASLLLSLAGFLQILGKLALDLGGASGLTARIDATFGNPIYLAAYMLFHIFLAAMLWMQMTRTTAAEKRVWPAVFYAGVIALDTLALFLTGTRGTMLGLIGGAFLTLILLSLRSEARRLRTITATAFIVLVVAAGGLYVVRDTSFVQSVGFLQRLSSISLSDATTKARFLNMGIAWQGVKERPLLGWGQENYALVFDKYYDPRMYAQEQWFDRVHDSIFDWWIAGGTLGLISFLSVFGVTLWILWRPRGARKDGTDAFTHEEKSILTGLLAGYFFHNLTVFDNVTSSILFVTVLGYMVYRETKAESALFDTRTLRGGAPNGAGILPESTLPFVAGIFLILGGVVAWFINGPAYEANLSLIDALRQQPAGPTQNIALLEQAISYGTYGTQEAREQLAQLSLQVAGTAGAPAVIKKQFVDATVHEFDLQSQASPLDARFPLFSGGVLNAAGDYPDAAKKLEQAHQLSPKKQSILYQMGQNAMQMGDTASAVADFKEAFTLDEENVTARLYYAALLITLGQDSEADAVLAPIVASGQAADQRILSAYAGRHEYAKLIPIWKAHVDAQPQDKDPYLTLVAVYYLTGDRLDAISTLQKYAEFGAQEKAQAAQLELQIESGSLKIQ